MSFPYFDKLTGEAINVWRLPDAPTDLDSLLQWAKDGRPERYSPALHKLISDYPLAPQVQKLLQSLRHDAYKGICTYQSIGICKQQRLLNLCLETAFSEESLPEVRAEALLALVSLRANMDDYRNVLHTLLSDKHAELQLAAAAAISTMGDVGGWMVILDRLKSSEMSDRLFAINVLTIYLSLYIIPNIVKDEIIKWLECSQPIQNVNDLYSRKRLLIYLWQFPLSRSQKHRITNLLKLWKDRDHQRCAGMFYILYNHLKNQALEVGGGWKLIPSSQYPPHKGNRVFADLLSDFISRTDQG